MDSQLATSLIKNILHSLIELGTLKKKKKKELGTLNEK